MADPEPADAPTAEAAATESVDAPPAEASSAEASLAEAPPAEDPQTEEPPAAQVGEGAAPAEAPAGAPSAADTGAPEQTPAAPAEETAPAAPEEETAPVSPAEETSRASPAEETAPAAPVEERAAAAPAEETGAAVPAEEPAAAVPAEETAPVATEALESEAPLAADAPMDADSKGDTTASAADATPSEAVEPRTAAEEVPAVESAPAGEETSALSKEPSASDAPAAEAGGAATADGADAAAPAEGTQGAGGAESMSPTEETEGASPPRAEASALGADEVAPPKEEGHAPLDEPVGEAPLDSASPKPEPQAEPEVRKPDANTVYHPNEFLLTPDPEIEFDHAAIPISHILSLDSHKRDNMFFIEDDVLMTASGCNVVFLRIPGMEQEYLPGLDGGGIGALAVHPTRKFFAVAEKCRHRFPNVYIYTYPEKKLVRVMRLGTERAYSALAFNDRGDMLASVGSYPDFLLTLWNWDEEAIILRSKAFSQEVYTVRFSPYLEGILNTCGTGHIRFWKMADTFTGLKLQGQLGKFGNVELTDVNAFVEMPDGKVLSGSERGELLMWDGGLIKVVLTRSSTKNCHDGNIQVLMHERTSNIIISGGADGYIRLWDFVKVNEAEAEEDSHTLAIQPLDELLIAPGARIKALLWERSRWIIHDEAGAIYVVTIQEQGVLSKTATVQSLLQFHSGGVVGMALSPTSHIAMTAGQDGSVRVFDYSIRKTLHKTTFNTPATVCTMLSDKADVMLVGFKDGVVRAVQRCHDGLVLAAAFKPHKGAITAIAIDKQGRRLATAGEEGTIFFFEIKSDNTFEPIIYTPLENGPATCLTWSEDGKQLLCGTRSSIIVELMPPELEAVDTQKTFLLEGIPNRSYTFKMPKPPKKKKEKKEKKEGEGDEKEDEGEAAPEAEKSEKPAGEASGTEGQEDEGNKEEGNKEDEDKKSVEEEEEEDAFQEAETFEIFTVTYQPDGNFLLTMGGKASGSVWSCSFDLPGTPTATMAAFSSAPTTVFKSVPHAPYMLMGSADGVVRVQPLEYTGGRPCGKMWEKPLHDMIDGRVSAVGLSFDEAYMLSAGFDGTICINMMQLPASPPPKEGTLEDIKTLELTPSAVPDILNPKEYTLEEAKQKAEQDTILAEAEAKKMGVRELLNQIRSEFEVLLQENEAKPEAERLPRAEFEIDPGLREMIEEETKQREEIARLELAWETEKRRLALAKLKAHFLDKVEVERIVLYSLDSSHYITTFRTAKLSDEVVEEMRQAAEREEKRLSGVRERPGCMSLNGSARALTDAEGHRVADGADGDAEAGSAVKSTGGAEQQQDISKMTKADLRRQARKKRESDWAAFNATKPDDKYENPADVAEIEEAERNMGDFKLKSDPNYVIPEEERMTPQRKRQQMLLLEGAMYDVRMDFNRRFLALREVKKKVIAEVNSKLLQLKEIREQLLALGASPDSEKFSAFSLDPAEEPEKREVVTDADLEAYSLRKQEEEKKAAAKEAGGFGGGGGGGAPAGAAAKKPAAGKPATSGGPTAAGTEPAHVGGGAEDALSKMMASGPQSELERNLAAYQRSRLEFTQSRLRMEIDEMVEAFDSALGSLRREKFQLEADLKLGEIKMLVHYQELTLLRDFDKREIVMIQKRQTKLDDRQEIVDKITDCNEKLEMKKKELQGLISRRAAVVTDFDTCVPETDPFREPLSKIFLKKIKRTKKKAKDDADGDSDLDDEEEEDEDMDEDEDDEGEEVCPSGCDQGLYERVCDLRERRLDEEDLITEFQKATEALKKEKETHAKKQRLVEQTLQAIEQDITEFQKEKQGRLNQIDVVVNLKMHQVEYLVDGRLPDDLGQGLVFSNQELQRLKRRIDELEQEKADLRARQKGLKKEHLQLLRDKRAKDDKVAEMERKAYDVQMLKFGQVIDLDLLDRVGSTRGTEELKEELKKQEAQYARELAEYDKKIAARTDELMALTRENTSCLNAVSELTMAQRQLEGALTATHNTMFSDPALNRRQEIEERDQLVQLVNAQASEIDKLKAQIGALRRKDTSVYS